LRFVVLAVFWPLIATINAIPWAFRNGRAIRAMTGKGSFRQFVEMVALAVRHRITPKYYYMFEFYHDDRRATAGHYVQRYETKQVAFRLLRPKVTTEGTPIKNKIGFAKYCQDHNLRAVPILMTFRDGHRDDDASVVLVLPDRDLFVKLTFRRAVAQRAHPDPTGVDQSSGSGGPLGRCALHRTDRDRPERAGRSRRYQCRLPHVDQSELGGG
jgi:hypothetical protein